MSNEWGSSWDDGNQWTTPDFSQSNQNQHTNSEYSNFGSVPAQNYFNQNQQNSFDQNQQQQSNNQWGGGNQWGNDPYTQPGQQNNQGFQGFIPGQQFMSDPMFMAAQQIGGKFAEDQKQKLTKYISGFNLKYYFAVDHSYVGKKLGILMFPFFHKEWAPKYSSDSPVPAREDVNAPDLYIPLMAFLTYVLISGFVLGTQGRFSPEMLGILTSNAFIWIIIENIIIFVSKYVMNISQTMSVWHSLAYSTYKFVGMIICLLLFMTGGKSMYYGALAYTAFCLSFFLLRTVKNFVFDTNHFAGEDGRKRKLMLILFILISQPLIMWWLTSGATSYEYGKFDFAQLAMSRMGMGAAKSDVPLTADGDVDYEALLKMPKD